MRHQGLTRSSPSKQTGVVLFVSMILLLILSMIGVTVARMQTVEERMGRNENNRQLAAQAAEAALRGAEAAIQQGTYTYATCAVGSQTLTGGAYSLDIVNGSIVPGLHWDDPTKVITFVSASLGAVPAPKYVIECLPTAIIPGETLGAGSGGGGANGVPVYRVTVQASGPDGNPSTLLQSIFRFQ